MALTQKPTMTDKNRTAHQRNGRQSRGAATPQGKERSRAAHLRHGFYSQQREEALRALGEDPAELAALIESTRAEWRPTSDFQDRLTERMARLWWRTERAERIQESLAARKMEERQKRRQERALELRYRLAPQQDLLGMLVEDSAQPRFYVPNLFFHLFHDSFGDKVEGARKDILLLMHRLRKPQGPLPRRGPGGESPAGAPVSRGTGAAVTGARSEVSTSPLDRQVRRESTTAAAACTPAAPVEAVCPPGKSVGGACPQGGAVPAPEADEDQYLIDMEELDDDDFPIPWPQTPVAEGAERKELSEALRVLARNELDAVHAALDPQIEEQEKPLTEIEQDEVQATPHKQAELMRRQEDSCFRQFMRLANLLLKMQKQEAKKCTRNEGSSGDVDENTEPALAERDTGTESEARGPESEVENTESEVGNGRSAAVGQSVGCDGIPESRLRTSGQRGGEAGKREVETECGQPADVERAAALGHAA